MLKIKSKQEEKKLRGISGEFQIVGVAQKQKKKYEKISWESREGKDAIGIDLHGIPTFFTAYLLENTAYTNIIENSKLT